MVQSFTQQSGDLTSWNTSFITDPSSGNDVSPISAQHSYQYLLPNLDLTLAVADNVDLRFNIGASRLGDVTCPVRALAAGQWSGCQCVWPRNRLAAYVRPLGFGYSINGTLVGTNKPYDRHNLSVSGFAVTGLAETRAAFFRRPLFVAWGELLMLCHKEILLGAAPPCQPVPNTIARNLLVPAGYCELTPYMPFLRRRHKAIEMPAPVSPAILFVASVSGQVSAAA